jgi:hypothetical protein
LWTKAGQVFDHTKEWDQRVFNEVALNMESLALLRIHRLDVEVFRSFMFENFTEYYVNEKVPENTVLFHMTCADKPVKRHISRTLGLFTSPVNYCDESHKYFALINPMYGTLEQLESSMHSVVVHGGQQGKIFIPPKFVTVVYPNTTVDVPFFRAFDLLLIRNHISVVEHNFEMHHAHICPNMVYTAEPFDPISSKTDGPLLCSRIKNEKDQLDTTTVQCLHFCW